ncbi:lymphatic vessel endothelial hyaluronic receptor 1b [Polymixia lowei]
MATVRLVAHLLLLSLAVCTLALDHGEIKVSEPGHVEGVFMIPVDGKYIFNATEARSACRHLNTTLATAAQMENALQHGLQTCRFGWIDGQIAAVPRITADVKCGNNKTGLATWRANVDKLFGAFCFSAADLDNTLTTTVIPVTSKATMSLPASKHTRTTVTSLVRSTPKAPSSTESTSKASERVPPVVTFTPLVESTRPSTISSTSSVTPVSPSQPVTASSLITVSLTSVPPSTVLPESAEASLGAVLTSLIVAGVILLLLIAAGAVWCYQLKRSVFPFWSRRQQKDDIETEMWKHTDSEMDLQSHQDEEEETDRKYSSDVTLCVNPDIKTNSSE